MLLALLLFMLAFSANLGGILGLVGCLILCGLVLASTFTFTWNPNGSFTFTCGVPPKIIPKRAPVFTFNQNRHRW